MLWVTVFFIHNILITNAKQVFEFPEDVTFGESDSTLIFKNITVPHDVENISICSSHKLFQINKYSGVFYSIYEQNETRASPWLNIGFLDVDTGFWAIFKGILGTFFHMSPEITLSGNYWYFVKTFDKSAILDWIHLCIQINFLQQKIYFSFNGGDNISTESLESFTNLSSFSIELGIVNNSWLETKSVRGKVTNLNIFYDSQEPLHKLSGIICNAAPKPDVNLEKHTNKLLGASVKEFDIDLEYICQKQNNTSIMLPFGWDFKKALKICRSMGNGSIFAFDNPENLTGIDFKYIFGESFFKFKEVWTPFTDVIKDGLFINVYDGKVIENIDWSWNQPNGGRQENNVVLRTSELKFYDAVSERPGTRLTCKIPVAKISLKGGCVNSHLERKFYATMINGTLAYLGFKNNIIR